MLNVSAGAGGLPGEGDLGKDGAATPKTNGHAKTPGNIAYLNRDEAGVNAANSMVPSSSASGFWALAAIAAHYRIAAQPEQIAHSLGIYGKHCSSEDIVRGAQKIGLKSKILKQQNIDRLNVVPLPAVLRLNDGQYIVLSNRLADGRFRLVSPITRAVKVADSAALAECWGGEIILLRRRLAGAGISPAAFNYRWFLASIWRYRRPLSHVLAASLFIQLFALITPLFFQVIIDKVLPYKGESTLLVIVGGLVLLGAFDVTLQYLRSYALNHTTSRIDVELGARLFDHLLRLPLSYFETRPTGQTVARIRELETIRSFLTGQGLSSIIDSLFAVIFISVLFCYSALLATIVLASIPFYVGIAVLVRPILRQRIDERFNCGAASQQFLVESIVGMQTLKAASIEPTLGNEWEEKLASYVRTSFKAVTLSNLGQNAIQYVGKATTAFVILFGARAVMNGEMSIGALVAFTMIMNQAIAPILRLSQLWQDFQQVHISVDRLGDILRSPVENKPQACASLAPLRGAIKFSDVSFRYSPDGSDVLRDINIEIPEGQVIGIVGPSGSGKSTLTKLVQRLYRPERGQIFLDGIDIGHVDTSWLRRQIGVVLQENLLFNRSIHDNIALANPALPRSAIMSAAKLAGADEFISKLPLGYDTLIEERGANLSGGQRQRIAIARALVTQPRILILDEATSALDYESEQIIRANMREMTKGRTVIIIAHRLAAVQCCERIIVVKDGSIVEDGSPIELRKRVGGAYATLHKLQFSTMEA
ncbi:peptidase domain-containing ABC transporter [Hyphomicrobium facile]|uniref:ATP-binding cassette, subfamily B, HlyB/CyaB n=1 Tax=Hyphomicrobium facile TaxID=51670 RepID=A0A1I7N5Q8_9HYPH|nr:ATP-binding cassette, subfamily B, HlyB/CyaB [Hyphomicrobium facile]